MYFLLLYLFIILIFIYYFFIVYLVITSVQFELLLYVKTVIRILSLTLLVI